MTPVLSLVAMNVDESGDDARSAVRRAATGAAAAVVTAGAVCVTVGQLADAGPGPARRVRQSVRYTRWAVQQ